MGQWQLIKSDGTKLDDELASFDTAYDYVKQYPDTSARKTVNGNGHMMTFNLISQTVVVVKVTKTRLPNGNYVYGSRP